MKSPLLLLALITTTTLDLTTATPVPIDLTKSKPAVHSTKTTPQEKKDGKAVKALFPTPKPIAETEVTHDIHTDIHGIPIIVIVNSTNITFSGYGNETRAISSRGIREGNGDQIDGDEGMDVVRERGEDQREHRTPRCGNPEGFCRPEDLPKERWRDSKGENPAGA